MIMVRGDDSDLVRTRRGIDRVVRVETSGNRCADRKAIRIASRWGKLVPDGATESSDNCVNRYKHVCWTASRSRRSDYSSESTRPLGMISV